MKLWLSEISAGLGLEPLVVALIDAIARRDADLVVIASPNDTHAPLADAALRAGKHVVVDKPFTLTLADPLPARFYPGDGSEVCEPVPAGDYRPYYSGVRDAILGLGANPVTPAQPVASIAVLETVVRAAGTGQMLPLPLTDAEHAAFA